MRCTKGRVIDVAIDLRKGSPTYKQWTSVALSDENKRLFFIPGVWSWFLTLSDDVEFQYKVDNLYNQACDRGIRYDDPSIAVDWGHCLKGSTQFSVRKTLTDHCLMRVTVTLFTKEIINEDSCNWRCWVYWW